MSIKQVIDYRSDTLRHLKGSARCKNLRDHRSQGMVPRGIEHKNISTCQCVSASTLRREHNRICKHLLYIIIPEQLPQISLRLKVYRIRLPHMLIPGEWI